MSAPSEAPKSRAVARHLVSELKALSPHAFDLLVKKARIKIDAGKRLDAATQVARAIVTQSLARDPSALGAEATQLLQKVASAGGLLSTESLPPAVEPLVDNGLIFAKKIDSRYELWIPSPVLLQLKPWLGEDPRGMRALLARTTPETISTVASHYLGHTAQAPYALALEAAWAVLGDPERLQHDVEKLPRSEHLLLLAIERLGGEVDTLELLELEREPLRMRTAAGASTSRRGVSYSLERRGFLIALPHGRHAIPTEIANIVAREERAIRDAERRAAVAALESHEALPRRARYAIDPAPFLAACLIATRETKADIREEIGTPKSLVTRLSARFGRSNEDASLLIAIGRSIGLWNDALMRARELTIGNVGGLLFDAWRTGSYWDEARSDREILRHQPEARELSPLRDLKRVLLTILQDLGKDRWLPFDTLSRYISSLNEMQTVRHLLARWATRIGATPGRDVTIEPTEILSRIVLETLPALGAVDVGRSEADDAPLVRLSLLGRLWIGDEPPKDHSSSLFTDDEILSVGERASMSSLASLAGAVEIGRVTTTLELHVSAVTIGNAVAAGTDPKIIERRLSDLADLRERIRVALRSAGEVIGNAQWVDASGFLWIADENVRTLLLERRQTAELFVHPSPPGGLLVLAGVDRDRLVKRCRTAGVEIEATEGRVVARAKR